MIFNGHNGFLRRLMPLTEQEGAGGAGGTGTDSQQQQAAGGTTQQQAQAPGIDYDKIQKMLEGTLSAKEDTALKAYFKQQGLSQEEMGQAIAAYKEQKAQNTPDVAAIQREVEQARQAALNAQIEKESLLLGVELGVDLKTMPYVIKMADLKDVAEDGNINSEKLKEALGKVLEDVPQLKAAQSKNEGNGGFRFGAPGGGGNAKTTDDQLKAAFGL